MAGFEELKPIYRSKFRVFLGKKYYRFLRYLNWYFGSGATCVYNYRDLQILNRTNETYQINVRVEED